MASPARVQAAEGQFTLPPLPWPSSALEPVISQNAVELHHGKHHRGYVKKLNELVAGTPLEGHPLEEVVRECAGEPARTAIFNNAAQAWNHEFFFEGLKTPGPVKVPAPLLKLIEKEFDSVDALTAAMVKAGVDRFGSGWAWLTLRAGHLEVSSSLNAATPLTTQATPLLALDVWEHAYYLDYHERREAYAKSLLAMLVDWSVVSRRAGL